MLNDLIVIKRSGKKVPYNSNNVYGAIRKGFISVQNDSDEAIRTVFNDVEKQIDLMSEHQTYISVGVIQDVIVDTMKKHGYTNVAYEYEVYRNNRDAMRSNFTGRQNKLVKALEKLGIDADENPEKRENANVDGNTAMGTMLQFGSTVSKEYAKSYLMSDKYSTAHEAGDIHIHDMDFMAAGCTTTCTQIPLDKLFATGFNTGHGYLRPPKGINSYAALACIAIQSNQNDQHGGQAIPLFDYYMAPGVLQTYKKYLKQEIYSVFDYEDALQYLNTDKMERLVNKIKHIDENHDVLNNLLPSPNNTHYSNLKKNIEKACERSYKLTDRATYQAMEALVANLNTMHSRCGAQVPFSSINYGTDTSPEGRMVIRNLLLAEMDGLGNGETPIFPISIFKVKDGVNYEPWTTNHDLLELACKVTSLRLFPNFAFLDAPFNKDFYREGVPESEAAYMGCVRGNEEIIYKVNDTIRKDTFKNVYEMFRNMGANERSYGVSQYFDLENTDVKVWDSMKHDFVKVKKLIKNPNRDNWHAVVIDDKKVIYMTSDHPLFIIGRGRVHLKDVHIGDCTYYSGANFTKNYNNDFDIEDTVCKNDLEIAKITNIQAIDTVKIQNAMGFGESYDVETESDMFDVSGIVSHNCRTRVIANVHQKKKEVVTGRGNLSFTTINLPRLGIKYGIALGKSEPDMDGFFDELENMCDLVKGQLIERYKNQCKKKAKNFPFMIGAGVWIDSEKLNPEDTIEKSLKHGTLTIGFIGLSECLVALTGKHHAESKESQELGLKIIQFMRSKCDQYTERYKLNFSVIATPAEGTAGRFVKMDRERFGSIVGVTDKEYYTNSFHVNVRYPISIKDKLAVEAPYHALTNGGHISYIEMDGLTSSNPDAIMQVVRMMHDAGIGYGAINHPVDRDPVCGYTGIIGDVCPRCGRKDGEPVSIDVIKKYKGSMYQHRFVRNLTDDVDVSVPNTFK